MQNIYPCWYRKRKRAQQIWGRKMPYKIGLAEKRKKILEEKLKEIVPKIVEMGVEKIILFGSLASDNVNRSSDIDLVVVKKTGKRFIDRLEEFYEYLNLGVATDIFVYTPEEFEQMKEGSFLKSALRKGVVLYEK